jgi:TnpA family transposase
MKILSSLERETYDVPPQFNSLERKKYFDHPTGLLCIAKSLRNPTNQVCFLVVCGYFSSTKRFFSEKFLQHDVEYVARQLRVSSDIVDVGGYDRATAIRHRQIILDYYGFREFDTIARKALENEIETMVRSQLKPRLTFYRAVDILVEQKVSPPSSDSLTKLILDSLNRRRKILVETVDRLLPSKIRGILDQLLEKATNQNDEPINRYRLTLLKKCSQSTKPKKIRESASDLQLLRDLHDTVRPVANELHLPHGAIQYFANSVIRSDTFDVVRRIEDDRYLHLIAFISHQFFRLQDSLVDAFLNAMHSAVNAAQREHKNRCYEGRSRQGGTMKSLVSFLDEGLEFRCQVGRITNESKWTDSEKLDRIRELMTKAPERNALADSLKQEIQRDMSSDDYYAVLEARSLTMQNRATPILKVITFNAECRSEPLLNAITHFKKKDGTIDKNAPTEFLETDQKAAVCNGSFRVSLYKAFLFIHAMGALKSGMLNLEYSYKYRPLEDYLIPRERWENEKQTLLERAGLMEFVDVKAVLQTLDEQLYNQYLETNENIESNANEFVRFTKSGSFHVKTPKLQEVLDVEPLQNLFPNRQYVPLGEVLATVDRHSGFLDEFRHWQQRQHRPKPAKKIFIAGISAIGCDIGPGKILNISRDIRGSELESTINWYFYPEGILAVNNSLLRFMDKLELANVYRHSSDALHTSSDGQKFEVRTDSLNANYSFKYFGKGKGVSVHSFIDERHLLFYSQVVSAAERESAYVIDGLMHNDVIKSDIHSTDTHGYSEAMFGTMHLLGFSYAPRIKNLKRQCLYLFPSRKECERSSWKINPSGYINTALIQDNWDSILRFITTIRLKETTASDLFRRLNSYSKQHSLYAALKAFGRIAKSNFILRYINDVTLRQAIERQLNKVESSHRMSRAISIGGGREIYQGDKQEQEVAEGCKRLIKNSIICWNYLFLTQKLAEQKDLQKRLIWQKSITAGSVVAWRHINLLGEYDFSDEKLRDSVGIRPPAKDEQSNG